MEEKLPILKRISENWKLDARLEDSTKYFFHLKEADDILNRNKCYIIGRKGSGKSAICQYITSIKKFDFFSEKLTFKNFPFRELYGLNNQKYTSPNQYITLWKFLIYSNVCKQMVLNQNIDVNVRNELEKLYPRSDVKKLAREISRWTSTEFGAQVFGNGGNLKISRETVPNSIDWIEKVDILEDVIIHYCDTANYYIVFDELDEDYRQISKEYESESYINLLTSLFKAVQDINSTFIGTNKNIKPIVFLRDDIYALIKDSDKNKWRDYKIEIEWNDLKLKNLLAFRISKDVNGGKIILPFTQAWDAIFSKEAVSFGARQGKKIHSFDYIARSTHFRPRDFIHYIQVCSEETYQRGVEKIKASNIKFVDRAFSNYLKDEITDEIFPLIPEIELVLQIISNLRKWNFNTQEFKNEYNNYLRAGTIKEKNIDYVLETLFNFSVIGNQHKTKKDIFYFKYQQTNMTFNKSENIVVHRGLFKALRII
ncbi:P-loop ATPase, Sll1717 family [Sphingobacterium sp. UBA2074]|uniref:P-loop ATPase, Sll1717 family n=1 Tax=Sphingobacterium sp. UBA2074 TaxID=1947487 RepID=UPI0025798DB4|nr:hypothetical protein [Sphingobacterium sp. UBA2074]